MFLEKEVSNILEIAKKAGDVILEYYHNYQNLSISKKEDDSFVTKADVDANDFITKELKILFPNIAIVSEENLAAENLKSAQNNQYFLIDPLDGTDGFIKKSDQFTVNIALIKNSKAVFGVIYLPALDIIYFTDENNQALKIQNFSRSEGKQEKINVNKNKNNLTVICTKREPEKSEIINDLKAKNISIKNLISVSSSYKFCLIAEGKADLYPRKVSIKSWDVAAGHAIVKAAGGNMIDQLGNEINYNFSDNFNVPFFEVY